MGSSGVARPGGPASHARAVEQFRAYLARHPAVVAEGTARLRGYDLACACSLALPCHGDLWLEVVHGPGTLTMADLASQLRQLADRVADLEPARLVGELEALKFSVWTDAAAPMVVPAAHLADGSTLDTPAAARLLGISATALRRLVAKGAIAEVRFGRRMVFRRETLERIRAERERARVQPGEDR